MAWYGLFVLLNPNQPTNLVVIRLVKILTPTVRNGFLGNTSGEPSLAHDDNGK